jgi:hypothetical protein
VKPDITADDLWPLVSKLSPQEQVRLARLALRAAELGSDHAPVAAPNAGGLSPAEDPLSWDAEGWEGLDRPR